MIAPNDVPDHIRWCEPCQRGYPVRGFPAGCPRHPVAPAPARAVSRAPRRPVRDGRQHEDALAAQLVASGFRVLDRRGWTLEVERGDPVGAWCRQYPWGLALDPERKFRSDLALPRRVALPPLLVEIDGCAHRVTEKRRKDDVLRRQLAEAADYRVLAFLPEQVADGAAIAEILRVLGRG